MLIKEVYLNYTNTFFVYTTIGLMQHIGTGPSATGSTCTS